MSKLRFKGKILLPTTILVTLLLVITLVIAIFQFRNFAEHLVDARIETAANGLRGFAEETRRLVIDLGLQISEDEELIQAVISEDTQRLLNAAWRLVDQFGVTYVNGFNADGIMIARSLEPDNFGDMVRTASLLEALHGTIRVAYSRVGTLEIPIRSSVPLFYQGEIIGGIVVAYALDTQKAVEALRARHDAEFSIIVTNDEGTFHAASTLTDAQGNSIVGRQVRDEEVLRTVIQQGQELVTNIEFYDINYSSFFMPLVDPYGNRFGTLFMGIPATAEVFA